MRRSLFKKIGWVLLTVWLALWAVILWLALHEWVELTLLFTFVAIVGVSRFSQIANAPDERGYFTEELPAKNAKIP